MGKKKEERAHALLSASSAKKWIHCPPSARLEDSIPEEESAYAKEGTLAHAVCELKLQKLFTDKNMTDRTYKGRLKKLQQDELYAPEMEGYADEYADYVSGIAFSFPASPFVAIEQNLESAEKNIKSSIKGSEDNLGETIAKFVISYGTEIKREFCKAIAEILYDILYSE